MKKDVAVSVKDVGMRFNLNQERVDNLKEYVIRRNRVLFKKRFKI